MKKLLIPITVLFLSAITLMCSKIGYEKEAEEITTKNTASIQAEVVCAFPVCDVSRDPDLRLVTNKDTSDHYFSNYYNPTPPIELTRNFVTTQFYKNYYGWTVGETVSRLRFKCLLENIAKRFWSTVRKNFSGNDWVWDIKSGYKDSATGRQFFNGLFVFDMFEKVDGYWHGIYSDYKKEFDPSLIEKDPYIDSMLNPDGVMQTYWTYHDYPFRFVSAGTGDFYSNYIRLPNRDGVYAIRLAFNPEINGCHAVKESDYTNNEVWVFVQISGSSLTVINVVQASVLPATSFTGTINKKNKTIALNIICPYMESGIYHNFRIRDDKGNVYTSEENVFELPIGPPFKTDYWVSVIVPGLGISVEVKCIKK